MVKIQTCSNVTDLEDAMIEGLKMRIRRNVHLTIYRIEGDMPREVRDILGEFDLQAWLRNTAAKSFENDYRKVAGSLSFEIEDMDALVDKAMPRILQWWEGWYPQVRDRYRKSSIQNQIFMQTFNQRIPHIMEEMKVPYLLGFSHGGINIYLTMPKEVCVVLKIRFSELSDPDLEDRFRDSLAKLLVAFSAARTFSMKIQPIDNPSYFKKFSPSWMLPDRYSNEDPECHPEAPMNESSR